MNKKNNLILFFLVCVLKVSTQNIGINATGANADASAALDVVSTNKGLLIPRVALTALNSPLPVIAPQTSLLVYNTATAGISPNNVVPGYYYWDGTKWISANGATSGGLNWNLFGNSGTSPASNFLGTTDLQDLVFKTNATEKVRVLANGRVGIATNSPNALLSLETFGNNGLTLSENVSSFPNGGDFSIYSTGANNPAYAQFIHSNWKYAFAQNQYAVNGGASRILFLNKAFINFQDVGNVNAGDIILQNAPTGSAGTPIPYVNTMALKANGNVGIGTIAPNFRLDVNGTTACIGNVWTSDVRKKKEIQTLNFTATDIIKKLNPVSFKWKEVLDDGMKGTQMGFIAQELETILPSMVITATDTNQSKVVKYNELLPVLVKALQEQQKLLDEMQKKIELLEKK